MKINQNGKEETKEQIRTRYKGIDRSILTVIPAKEKTKLFEDTKTKRVAAYCRVSTDDVKQTSSYELQKNHYEDMIKEHAGWELVGIYADEGISGTSLLHRVEFNRMIEDCLAGKIDLVVTKSVSRFARNIVDCIDKQRMLAALNPPVGVFFETERIYSLDSTSEMMMAVLAAAAQEESHTKSEIMNISIEQRFSRGIFLTPKLLGYDLDEDGNLIINEEEADTVRLCYYLCLSGFPLPEIADILTELGRKTKHGLTRWNVSTIKSILENERHCGDVLSRKTFTPNYLDHKTKKNDKDRNQYMQMDHHEAIVSREIFEAARQIIRIKGYTRSHTLPKLQVIHKGALKGFVPVDLAWDGYGIEDYREASSVVEDQTPPPEEIREQKDLPGFQVVRAQFFHNLEIPRMTIGNGFIQFNAKAYEKLNCETVNILFSVTGRKIAVICSRKELGTDIRWIRESKEKKVPRRVNGKKFLEHLIPFMGWQENFTYKVSGKTVREEDHTVLMFDLLEAEVIRKAGENTKMYPADWGSSFGNTVSAFTKDQESIDFSVSTIRTEDVIDDSAHLDIEQKLNELMNRLKTVPMGDEENG